MYQELLQNIQNQLAKIPDLKYIDENWGQLDYYSPNIPVQYPCCLIDIQDGQYSNIGTDFGKSPKKRQKASLNIELLIANMRLSNTSFQSPRLQKDSTWQVFDWIESVHKKMHGFVPLENASPMLRKVFGRVQRDDGIQEYLIIYTLELINV